MGRGPGAEAASAELIIHSYYTTLYHNYTMTMPMTIIQYILTRAEVALAVCEQLPRGGCNDLTMQCSKVVTGRWQQEDGALGAYYLCSTLRYHSDGSSIMM